MMDINEITNDVMSRLHFVGKNHYRFDEDGSYEKLRRRIRKGIDAQLTELALSADNFNMELPRLTEKEYIELEKECVFEMAKQKGIPESELEEIKKAAEEAVKEAIRQHREHLEKDFAVVGSEKKIGNDVNDAINAVPTLAFLQCVERVTQELNIAMYGWEQIRRECGNEKGADILKKAVSEIGPDLFWTVRELCRIHGENLLNIGKAIEQAAGKPDTESMKTIQEALRVLPHKYQENSLYSQYIGNCADAVDLQDKETAELEEQTGSADPGTVSEIMKRLNRIEESLHSIGQQVEAIWLKTGAVELDAESIAEDLEGTEPEQ